MAALCSQFAHLARLLADVTSASPSPDAHRWVPGPALRLPFPSWRPPQLPGPVSRPCLFNHYHGLRGRVAESQMANTGLPCDKRSLGQISYRKVPRMFSPPCNPVYASIFKGVIKLVLIKCRSRNQALMFGSWQLRFPLKDSKTSKRVSSQKKEIDIERLKLPGFPGTPSEMGATCAPH